MSDYRLFGNGVDPSYERELAARKHGTSMFFATLLFWAVLILIAVGLCSNSDGIFMAAGFVFPLWLIIRLRAAHLRSRFRL
ncbi:MAG: hypothetical protein LBT40_01505 [Deltaproteobacteria bacterium]|jgi:hypothetical protein|nr:hypothetical protein [Deltaproteobacteria bacterium]